MLDWVLLAVGVATAVYWYLTRRHNTWQSRHVYTAPGCLPWVGHMWESLTLSRSVQWKHNDIYSLEKSHPAVGIYSFQQPALVLRDLDLVKTVLIGEFSNFHDNTWTIDETLDPLTSKNPFVLTGQRWKTLRQKLSPALSPVRVKNMFPLVQQVCQQFNKYIEKHQHEDIDVKQVTGYFTSEVVAKVAFALDGNIFNDPNSDFYNYGRRMWDGSLYSPLYLMTVFFFPFINKILRKSFVPKDASEFFTSVIKQTVEYRQKNPDKVPDNDYLSFLLNLQNKDPDFTLEDVVAQGLTFFTDGFESSSFVATFVIYELTVNPDIQEELRNELKGMDSFSFDSIMSLPLLDRVFQETLRKYSVLSLVKLCTNDTVLQVDSSVYPLKKGDHVVIPVYGIHNDPEIYPNPDKFDPDRFLPENVKSRHPMAFFPFGDGPRICIGYKFATFQIKVLLANIVTKFKLVKCEKTEEKLKLDPQQLMTIPDKPIWVRFQTL